VTMLWPEGRHIPPTPPKKPLVHNNQYRGFLKSTDETFVPHAHAYTQ
jgi:hypothetical protein